MLVDAVAVVEIPHPPGVHASNPCRGVIWRARPNPPHRQSSMRTRSVGPVMH